MYGQFAARRSPPPAARRSPPPAARRPPLAPRPNLTPDNSQRAHPLSSRAPRFACGAFTLVVRRVTPIK
jgi:hypothetical protein